MSPIKEARFDRLIQEQTLAGFQIGLINKVQAAFYENVMQQRNVEFRQEILEISQRMLIEALIHYAKRERDAGKLSYSALFELTAEARR